MNIISALNYKRAFESQTCDEESIELYLSILDTPKGDVVEIGSACGGTTIVLIAAAEEVNKTVYSVDPYPKEFENFALEYTSGIMNEFELKFKSNILDNEWGSIIQYKQRLKDCIEKIPDRLSTVFIDGCHELSFVLEDISLIEPKMVKGGRIYLHDIFWDIGQISKVQGGSLYNVIQKYQNAEIFKINNCPRMLRINI